MKAIILAGGMGSRLWPMSRDLKPKQFHSFVGNRTMLQQTYGRLDFLPKKDIFVATSSQYETLVKKQLPNLAAQNIIIEPAMRDTAPCICYAAKYLKDLGFEREVMTVIYADHLIQKPDIFSRALRDAEQYIQKERALAGLIAVPAKFPNPNLGYVRIGKAIVKSRKGFEIFALEEFMEKPSLEIAKLFAGNPGYLWNTGLFLWKVSTILRLFQNLAPEIYRAVMRGAYAAAPKISVDYAIMEKINPRQVRVIPADLGWNDIGNWAALHQELAPAKHKNVSSGEHLGIDTEGSLVIGGTGKLIVTYGVKNLVVVDTEEALLIMPKNRAPDAKRLVEEIKKHKKEKFL